MNKIEVEKIFFSEEDHNIPYHIHKSELILDIIEDTHMILKDIQKYQKIIFKIKSNCSLHIKQISSHLSHIEYEYLLEENSSLTTNLFHYNEHLKEKHSIHLNGKGSKVNFVVRAIALQEEEYHIQTYHYEEQTESNIVFRGINRKEGSIHVNVESIVPKQIKNCTLNQDNRIYTLNQKKCTINPVLKIENNDVIANHAAFIGTFDEETIFYLMTRGISRKACYHLLIKGFLNIDNDEQILSIIHKYWR